MPYTLRTARRTRRHLQPLLHALLASAPPRGSRCSPAATRTTTSPRQRLPRRRLPRLRARGADTAQPPRPGCRATATARSTSASSSTPTAKSRTDRGVEEPPGWNAWHTVLNSDTTHYFYGYALNNNGVIEGPYGESGSWETREYGAAGRLRLPVRPAERPALPSTRPTSSTASPPKSWRTPPEKPSTCSSTTPPPHGDFRLLAGPEPAPRDYESLHRRAPSRTSLAGLQRGQRQRQAQLLPRCALPLRRPKSTPIASTTTKALESLRLVDQGVKDIVDTLGALHRLQNTYIIFTSDNGFFYGEHRLVGGKFLAYEPSTDLPFLIRGPGIKPGPKPASWPRPSTSRRRSSNSPSEADRSIDGRSLYPVRARHLACAAAGRCSSSPSSQTNDVEQDGGARADRTDPRGSGRTGAEPARPPPAAPARAAAACPGLDRGAAEKLLRDPARPRQVHRVARRREGALRHHQGPLRAQQQGPRPQLLPDPRLPPQRTRAPGDLRRQGPASRSRRNSRSPATSS